VLFEVADTVEQTFRIACTEKLHPRPEEYDAAACDYQAAHGLTYSRMCEQMRQYGAMREIRERADAPLQPALASVGAGRRREDPSPETT